MYIAFKWLFGLSSAMWVAMCCIDFHFNRTEKITALRIYNSPRNTSKINGPEILTEKYNVYDPKTRYDFSYLAFFIGSITLLCVRYRRCGLLLKIKQYKTNIVYANLLYNINMFMKNVYNEYLNIPAKKICVAISSHIPLFWDFIYKIKNSLPCSSKVKQNLALIKRFKELNEERRSLGKLLLTTIRENKNIRMRYQLENLAKNRLTRYIADAEKAIKENRCQYVSFQQLYLTTHKENLFLKARIKKLTTERDNVEKSLMTLVNEILKSNNDSLKSFCCRFIVNPRSSLLNSDINAEIRKFLNSNKVIPKQSAIRPNPDYDYDLTEIVENNCIIISEAPKLRGLPGEYVWTVKDKDGLIEKLYEYNFQTDCDNGDTIRRIREYSVYCDKDCLLDYTSSSTIINNHWNNYPIAKHRFLTGSPAFQKFLKYTGSIVVNPSITEPNR